MIANRWRISGLASVVLVPLFFVLASSARGAAEIRLDAWGPGYQNQPGAEQLVASRPRAGVGTVRRWNAIMLEANAIDHARSAPDGPEQLGPVRTARAFAIVQIAVFDAMNAIIGGYRGYTPLADAPRNTDVDAAVAQAAHDALVALFPAQTDRFDALLADDLARLRSSLSKYNGIRLGRRAAAAILTMRADDGSQRDEMLYGSEYLPAVGWEKWVQDPISRVPIALGAFWGESVTPFVMRSSGQFATAPPPAPGTQAFIDAFNEVKQLGGCGGDQAHCAMDRGGALTSTQRTAEQEQIGIFWGYDGTPGLGTPPRFFNQIAVQIASQKRSGGIELARLLALMNVAMADSGLAAWESKYVFEFGRPITVIRGEDPADGGDPTWTPLGAPASNKIGPNFTPPFPAFPSGHATFGGAVFQVLRTFYGTDRIDFTVVSDEYNGVTKDHTGAVRPLLPRHFTSFSQAEEENGQSRIYLGIHWAFDKTEGELQGHRVANYVMRNAFTPLRRQP